MADIGDIGTVTYFPNTLTVPYSPAASAPRCSTLLNRHRLSDVLSIFPRS